MHIWPKKNGNRSTFKRYLVKYTRMKVKSSSHIEVEVSPLFCLKQLNIYRSSSIEKMATPWRVFQGSSQYDRIRFIWCRLQTPIDKRVWWRWSMKVVVVPLAGPSLAQYPRQTRHSTHSLCLIHGHCTPSDVSSYFSTLFACLLSFLSFYPLERKHFFESIK